MENLDLINYIQQARKSGMGDNKIREGLLQAGWPVSSVEEAIMSKENPKSEVLNSKQGLKIQNSNTSIRNAIFAILFLGIAVVGYFGGAYYMANYQYFPLWPFEVSIPVSTFAPRPSPTNLEAKLPSDTSGWLTYRNEEYGFEFRYPVDWAFKQYFSNADGFFISKNSSKLAVLPKGEFDYGLEGEMTRSSLKLSGKTVILSSWDNNSVAHYQFTDSSIPTTWIKCKSDLLNCNRIDLNAGTYSDITLLNQILSTFQFIK